MNKEEADLALAALDERHRVISPAYAELMGKFGQLALNTATVDGLRQEAAVSNANEGLILDFIIELPRIKQSSRQFPVDTAQEAKLIQASIIWGGSIE